MPEHDVIPLGEVHIPYNWSYADATARGAASGFIPADVGKFARQLDDNTIWMLTDDSPVAWVQVGGAGALADDSVTNTKLSNMAQSTIKGRAAGAGTGDPTDLSAAQVASILTEDIQDIVGAMFADSASVDFTYDDGAGTVSAVAIGAPPSGSAGGDLTGTYPNPSVVKTSLTGAHGSDDTWTGTTISGLNAGATIAQWEAVYLDGSSTWQLADANGTGTYPARGLATAAYSSTDPAVILVHGTARNDAWNWTPGGVIYLSATAGGLTQTAPSTSGDKVQQVGFALTADIAFFDFNATYLTVT